MRYFILITTLFLSINTWGINPPVNLSPSNGSTNQSTTTTIDWTAVTGNTGYLYELDTTPNFNSPLYVIGNTNVSSKVVSNLLFGTTYYWRAATKGPIDTSVYTTTWSFTTLDAANNVLPSNGAMNQSTTITIDWDAMSGNNGYIYEIDTSPTFNSPLYESGSTPVNNSSKVVSNLLFGTKYYWRAAIKNANDTSGYGAIWNFTTLDAANNISPSNGLTNQPTTTTIDWSAMSGNNGYIYEIDTSPTFNSPLYESGSTPVNSSEKTVSNLLFGTTYYWRAAVKNANDTSGYGAIWNFTTLDAINNVSPFNGAMNRSTTTTIDWSAMLGNNGYIYEIDTSPTFNSPLYESGSTAANSSQKTVSNLLFGTKYYWRAGVTNVNDTSSYGATWNFTTEYQLASGPSLLSPTDASMNVSTTVVQFVWNSIANANNYQIMYSTTSNFTSAVNSITTAQLNTTVANLDANTTYYWRVRGSNGAGYSPWSTVWSFTTEMITTSTSTIPSEKITIYPNPVQDRLQINLGERANYYLMVVNMQGQIIDEYQFNDSQTTYNTSNLMNGIYFIELNKEGEKSSFKFIKN